MPIQTRSNITNRGRAAAGPHFGLPASPRSAYPWPLPPGAGTRPLWTGHGFDVDGRHVAVLGYGVGDSGWTDDLTSLHENAAGSDHFIDRASRRHAIDQIRRHLPKSVEKPVILEVGCSSGFLLHDMRQAFPQAEIIGSDYVRGPLEVLARTTPDLPLLQFDMVQCPLPSESVDVVVALNVLEHIEDDTGAMRQMLRVLRPGGVAVLEIPAGPHLFDVHDRVLMHFRRYRLKELRRQLEGVGFEVPFASSLGTLLYPGFWLVKQRNRKYLAEPPEVQRRVVEQSIRQTGRNRLMEGVMVCEDFLRKVIPLPVGIRCLATARKPR